MMEDLGHMVIGAFVTQMVGVVATVIGGYRMLAYRIGQQEEIMKGTLNNGIRADIRKVDAKLDKFAGELRELQGEHRAHHGRGRNEG